MAQIELALIQLISVFIPALILRVRASISMLLVFGRIWCLLDRHQNLLLIGLYQI